MPYMKVICFDLGETLFTYAGIPLSWVDHYEPALRLAYKDYGEFSQDGCLDGAIAILKKYNTRLVPRLEEVSSGVIFREINLALGIDPISTKKIEAEFFRYFQQKCSPYPETRSALVRLKAQGFRIGLLTDVPYGMSRDFVLEDIKSASIADCFDLLLTSVDVGYRKPHPEAFRQLAIKFGISSQELVYVGNEKKDVEGVVAVGGTSILVDPERRLPLYGQSRTITSLIELVRNP